MSGRHSARVLPVAFFQRSAAEVARELLGSYILSRIGRLVTGGLIVETEAYLGYHDPASHAFEGRRHEGNTSIYGPPGTWYVYRSYGIHWCANLVCAPEGVGGAVLLRGVHPVEGAETMRRRRRGAADRVLCNGPGKLCQALGITRALDGRAMASSPVLVLQRDPAPEAVVRVTPRIGLTRAVEWPLRFVLRANGQ